MKKILALSIVLSMLFSINVFAADVPMVWAFDPAHADYESYIQDTIVGHVPQSTIKAFNAHQGQVVISQTNCDPKGKAGITNGEPTASGWYTWPNGKVYVDITPTYGLPLMQQTVLHEFGHVFDMQTGATNDATLVAVLNSELPNYNALEANSGYIIPSVKDSHELFAQVFAAVVSRNDGTVRCSSQIIAACPQTASYISSLLAKNR